MEILQRGPGAEQVTDMQLCITYNSTVKFHIILTDSVYIVYAPLDEGYFS